MFANDISLRLCVRVSRLGGVVVSVIATGPKGLGCELCQGDGF
jgi:hypothetical protein